MTRLPSTWAGRRLDEDWLQRESCEGIAFCGKPLCSSERSRWRRSAQRPPTSWCGGRRGSTRRRTRPRRRSSLRSSRTPASRLSSFNPHRMRCLTKPPRRSRRAGRPFPVRQNPFPTTSGNGRSTVGSLTLRRHWPLLGPIRSRRARLVGADSTRRGAEGFLRAALGWRSLLEQAGVHPRRHPEGLARVLVVLVRPGAATVRRATGRDDIWGVGLNMSGEASDTQISSSSSWPPTRRTT